MEACIVQCNGTHQQSQTLNSLVLIQFFDRLCRRISHFPPHPHAGKNSSLAQSCQGIGLGEVNPDDGNILCEIMCMLAYCFLLG